MSVDLRGMSADELLALAKRAKALAEDLRKEEPSVELALLAGIRDKSYRTVRYGWVPSYEGTAEVTLDNGRRFRAVGHRPDGDAESIYRNGYVEFIPLDVPEPAEV